MNAQWRAKVAASALVRRLVYLAVAAVIAWAGMGHAQAQTTTSCSTSRSIALDDCDNGETARAASIAAATDMKNSGYNYGGAVTLCTVLETPTGADPRWYSRVVWQSMGCSHGGFSNQHYRRTFSASAYCATGNEWDAGTQTCNPAGPTDEECQAINAQPGFAGVGPTSRSFKSKCMANGCMFEVVGPSVTATDTLGSVTSGQFEWTGACPAPPAPDAPTVEAAKEVPEQTCTGGTGNEVKLCVKRDGEHCLSFPAGTGKQACWTPGEVGEKTSGEHLQKRNPGTTPDAPSRSDVTQVGTPKTTTTTKEPQNTVITTTTTNYITNNGTDAGATDDGEPDDGSGGDDEEEQEGSVTDDGTCDAQPVVDGGDPLLANIILQTWGARCAQADDNAVTTTGGAIDDCGTPWAITGGTDANVAKLKAMRKSICPDTDDASAGKGAGDYGVDGGTDGSAVEAQTFEELWGEPLTYGQDGLDDTGLAGFTRACPQMPVIEVMGVSVDFNVPAFCNWMQLGGQLLLIVAALGAVRDASRGM